MSSTKRIIFALAAFGETGKASFLAQGADSVTATCQDLVRIALVADIPDDAVMRRVKDVMKGNCQFDNAKSGAQMTAGNRNRIQHFCPQFFGQLWQL